MYCSTGTRVEPGEHWPLACSLSLAGVTSTSVLLRGRLSLQAYCLCNLRAGWHPAGWSTTRRVSLTPFVPALPA